MTFLVQADALARAKERAAATDADDDLLNEWLVLSAGEATGPVTHYRPYWVAATYLEQSLQRQQISEADGAKFTLLKKPIESLLQLQAAYDASQGLDVPAGFEAVPDDCKTCAQYAATSANDIRYQAVSLFTQVG